MIFEDDNMFLQNLLIKEKYESNVSKINSITHQFSDVSISSSNILIQALIEIDELIEPDIFIYYTVNSTNALWGAGYRKI